MRRSGWLSACAVVAACSADDPSSLNGSRELTSADANVPAPADDAAPPASTLTLVPSPHDAGAKPEPGDPGPKPTPDATCALSKDGDGFFTRWSGKGSYVGYLPKSWDQNQPTRAIVAMHGCGDEMTNFAKWGVSPWATRDTQDWIGISVGSETGSGKCWSMGADDDKVLAAVDDLARCVWIHHAKVVVAGFSSGGMLAYRVGLAHADRFAGILIEHSGLYAAGGNESSFLGGAAWKLNIAHRAAWSDTVFPIDDVRADWTRVKAAGFPLETSETAGDHNGTSDDWSTWLLPISATWTRQ